MRQIKISAAITNRDSESLEKYLREISKIPMISPEQEVVLAKKIKQGDDEALYALVQANLRFVVSVAKQYQNQGLSLPDLINEGNLGAIKAAQRFDETTGNKFISYAVWWIRQSIMQAIAETGNIVRLPQNKVVLGNKIQKEIEKYEHKHHLLPSNEELAELLEVDIRDIKDVRETKQRHTSIDTPIDEKGEVAVSDTLVSEQWNADKVVNTQSVQTEIDRVLKTLKPREREIIEAHFGINGKTTEDVTEKYGITKERARQIRERALGLLSKKASTKRLLKPCLQYL